jgi:4-diphosphocytidyl-2-C-methyl-D-erythritol kinase
MRVEARAKVNLFLRVLGRRADGYHDVETILHGVALADEVEVELAEAGVDLEVRLEDGFTGTLPPARQDLAWRAARAYLEAYGGPTGARIGLLKRIPIAAGLGGGSADAAAVLRALDALLGRPLPAHRRADLAASLGSDIPYFLVGGTALATGRGEAVAPVPAPVRLWIVLGVFSEPLATSEVYGRARPGRGPASAPMREALGAGDVVRIAELLHNDLEPAALALRPELAPAKEALLEAGALGALVSGSGPTVFALARDELHARAIAAGARRGFDRMLVTHSSN